MRTMNRNTERPRKKGSHSPKTPWREFELLVSRIESAVAPEGATVKSPAFLWDSVAHQQREVDATITYKVGTTPIVIMVECRDRHKIQDVLWIEQLATKQRDLRAAKCVAVTSSGFTRAAVTKAEALGIELRTIKFVDAETIKSWKPLRTWFYRWRHLAQDLTFGIGDVIIEDLELERELNADLRSRYYLEDPLLQSVSSNRKISLAEYVVELFNRAYDHLSEQEKLSFTAGTEHVFSWAGVPVYTVETSRGPYDVIGGGFKVAFDEFFDYSLTPASAYEYSNQDRPLITGNTWLVETRDGKASQLSTHKDLDTGKVVISRSTDLS